MHADTTVLAARTNSSTHGHTRQSIADSRSGRWRVHGGQKLRSTPRSAQQERTAGFRYSRRLALCITHVLRIAMLCAPGCSRCSGARIASCGPGGASRSLPGQSASGSDGCLLRLLRPAAGAPGRGPHGAAAAAAPVGGLPRLVGRGVGEPAGCAAAHLLQPLPQHAAHQGAPPAAPCEAIPAPPYLSVPRAHWAQQILHCSWTSVGWELRRRTQYESMRADGFKQWGDGLPRSGRMQTASGGLSACTRHGMHACCALRAGHRL